jgi:translocation and assembly module TamA
MRSGRHRPSGRARDVGALLIAVGLGAGSASWAQGTGAAATSVPARPSSDVPTGPPPASPSARSGDAAAEPPTLSGFLSTLPFVGKWFGGGEEAGSPDGSKVAPHYVLEVEAPEPVARQIRESTLLGRWRQRPDYDPSQLQLFIRRAEAESRELLAAEGWFSPTVRVEAIRGGVRIEVEAGPRTRVEGVTLQLDGELAGPAHAALRERVEREWLLPGGALFRSSEWERAKRALLSGLRDGGFLRARIEESEAVVERDRALAALRVDVDSGPPMYFGALDVGGLQRYPQDVVDGLATFRRGDPYDARRVTEFQTRLNGAGWFTSVNVRPDMQALERDPDTAEVPVRIDVVERQTKRWTLGGGYDTDRGVNLLAAWEHRNVGGLGVQTFNGVEVDVERQVAYSTWETPQDVEGWRWQFGARAEHRDIQNDLVDAASVFASRNRRRGDIETALSLQYQAERQNVVFAADDERLYENRALVLGYTWTQRRLDSPIFPTQGYIVSGQVSGASASFGSARSFVRAYGLGYGIVPLATDGGEAFGRIVLRGEIGAVLADAREGIPSANLFRTGGTKSVRGYGSQSLGVPLGQATVGGRFLLVTSAEYQHLITRDIALAVFYDWGNAADTRSGLEPVAGYGAGVRWRTPVGPLNLDLAWGEAIRDWRLHFSIGVVF